VGVGPEVTLEVFVIAGDSCDPVSFNVDRERMGTQDAVAGAEEVTYDAVDDEDAVDFSGCGEALAARQVAPLFSADNSGGFEPSVVGVELGVDVGAGGGGGADVGGGADLVENGLRRSMARKSALMPWVMISGVMLTIWAWRMRRRLTTSVICIRL
jgi:hypothetical protein